jgi:hypothetical protein
VANPGYLTPPTGSQTISYFTARDAFRLEGQKRTDVAANYNYDLNVGGCVRCARPRRLLLRQSVRACPPFNRTNNPGQWVGALVLAVPIRD